MAEHPAPSESSAAPPVRVVPLPESRRAEFLALDQEAFIVDPALVVPDEDLEDMEWDRAFAALTDADELAGIHAAFSFRLSVPTGPGGAQVTEVPAAGLTWVGVAADHRRQGVMRAMLTHHVRSLRGTPEPVSVLHASEQGIYGRFGYGLASTSLVLKVGRGTALRPVEESASVRVRTSLSDPAKHASLVHAAYDVERRRRPGMVARSEAHSAYVVKDNPRWRKTGEPRRILVAERDGAVTGYAVVRREAQWTDHGRPEGTVSVLEVVAHDPATVHALWSRLLDVDLTATVSVRLAPDDPLLRLLVDARGVTTSTIDDLWVRLVEVDRALGARGYSCPVDVVLDVTDAVCEWNAGRWRLTGGPDGATCTRTTDAPDLSLDVRELGSVWLGGTTLTSYAAAGLVTEHTPGALAAASQAFRAAVDPVSTWVF